MRVRYGLTIVITATGNGLEVQWVIFTMATKLQNESKEAMTNYGRRYYFLGTGGHARLP